MLDTPGDGFAALLEVTVPGGNYSVVSLDELRGLVGVPLDSTASMAGYRTAGDNGGGDFTFIPVSDANKISKVRLLCVRIGNPTQTPAGVTFETPDPHGFAPGQSVYIYLKDGDPANGAYVIEASGINPATSFVAMGLSSAGVAADSRASCVELTTKKPHGRLRG